MHLHYTDILVSLDFMYVKGVMLSFVNAICDIRVIKIYCYPTLYIHVFLLTENRMISFDQIGIWKNKYFR